MISNTNLTHAWALSIYLTNAFIILVRDGMLLQKMNKNNFSSTLYSPHLHIISWNQWKQPWTIMNTPWCHEDKVGFWQKCSSALANDNPTNLSSSGDIQWFYLSWLFRACGGIADPYLLINSPYGVQRYYSDLKEGIMDFWAVFL